MGRIRCVLSFSVAAAAAIQVVCMPLGRAQEVPPGEPEVQSQGSDVAPPAPGYAPPPGDAPPPLGPLVTVRSDNPRARLQTMGPLKWQDVCVAPCNRPVDPRGLYRIGGGTIRASETFKMPRPSGQVVIDTEVGSTVKHWVGVGLIVGGAASALLGGLYYAAAEDISRDNGTSLEAAKGVGIAYLVVGVVLMAVGLPLSFSSTSVEVR